MLLDGWNGCGRCRALDVEVAELKAENERLNSEMNERLKVSNECIDVELDKNKRLCAQLLMKEVALVKVRDWYLAKYREGHGRPKREVAQLFVEAIDALSDALYPSSPSLEAVKNLKEIDGS